MAKPQSGEGEPRRHQAGTSKPIYRQHRKVYEPQWEVILELPKLSDGIYTRR